LKIPGVLIRKRCHYSTEIIGQGLISDLNIVWFILMVMMVPVKLKMNRFNPDEISSTEISSRLNRLRISKSTHLTGQVGQADKFQLTADPRG